MNFLYKREIHVIKEIKMDLGGGVVRSKLLPRVVFSLLTFKGSMDMEGVSTAVPPSVLTSDQSDSKCLPPLSDTADRFVPSKSLWT